MGNLGEIFEGGFDTNQVDPTGNFEPLPAGWYSVQIDSAEVKKTQRGDGYYLKVSMTVLDSGRKLFDQINLRNPNPTAEEIGQRQLSALGRAAGFQVMDDEDKLLGKMVKARVKVKKDQQYGDDNEIQKYEAIQQSSGSGQQQPQQPPASAPAETANQPQQQQENKPPWKR